MEIAEAKAALRAKMAAIRMPPDERAEGSRKICGWIEQLESWLEADTVLLFAPLPDEPDVTFLQAHGKTLCLPRAYEDEYAAACLEDFDELIRGKFGVLEPSMDRPVLSAEKIDLVIVPGVAFDMDGHRLGRGGGFYDRWLRKLPGKTIGVCFDHQLTRCVPTEPHDIRVERVVWPSGGGGRD